jgi:hypothetical protein
MRKRRGDVSSFGERFLRQRLSESIWSTTYCCEMSEMLHCTIPLTYCRHLMPRTRFGCHDSWGLWCESRRVEV